MDHGSEKLVQAPSNWSHDTLAHRAVINPGDDSNPGDSTG